MNQTNLETVDWNSIPKPSDDGSANHLDGELLPDVALPSTAGGHVDLGQLLGWNVIYFYPMTGRPDVPLPDGWDDIPGARGCTPQSCAFRDLSDAFLHKGVSAIYGISTQSNEYQCEAADRLHLPFPLLSDANLQLTEALRLPTMKVGSQVLIRRLTFVLYDTQVKKVFFPVFPPSRNAEDVLSFLDTV